MLFSCQKIVGGHQSPGNHSTYLLLNKYTGPGLLKYFFFDQILNSKVWHYKNLHILIIQPSMKRFATASKTRRPMEYFCGVTFDSNLFKCDQFSKVFKFFTLLLSLKIEPEQAVVCFFLTLGGISSAAS